MREIDSIPHPHCMVKIYNYNGRFIVKMSYGDVNIEYKIKEEDLPEGIPQLRKIITEDFIDKHASVFANLSEEFADAFEKANE